MANTATCASFNCDQLCSNYFSFFAKIRPKNIHTYLHRAAAPTSNRMSLFRQTGIGRRPLVGWLASCGTVQLMSPPVLPSVSVAACSCWTASTRLSVCRRGSSGKPSHSRSPAERSRSACCRPPSASGGSAAERIKWGVVHGWCPRLRSCAAQ